MTDKEIEIRKKEIEARAIALNNGDFCGCGKYFTKEEKREIDELNFRGLIISALAYGEGYLIRNDRTNTWGRSGLEYSMKLGELEARKIWENQRDFFNKHAKIHWGVHTDYEGCSYNSLTWDC